MMVSRKLALATLVVALVALRVAHVRHAQFEVDELQHLHAAYLVASGQTPYVDFFEHHTPLFYHLGALGIDPATASVDTVLYFRLASLAMHLLVIALGTLLAASLGTAAGVAALALLGVEIFSFAWGSLSFLDSYAAPLLLASALLLSRCPRAPLALFGVGALIGCATLFTQKAVFASLGPLLCGFLDLERGPNFRRKAGLRGLAALAAGGLAPLVLLLAWRGMAEAAGLVENALLLNTRWVARRWPLGELFIALAYNGTLWLLAAVGGAGLVWRTLRADEVSFEASVPFAYLLGLLVGALVMPVVWYEYFIQIGPFVAVAAAITAVDLARIGGLLRGEPLTLRGHPALFRVAAAALVAIGLTSLAARLVVGHHSPHLSAPGLGVLIVALGVVGFVAVRAWRSGRRLAVAGALLTALCLPPLLYQVEWLRRSGNATQRQMIDLVQQAVAPGQSVLDGYSGYGVFRPHAYRYWFLHDEIQQMLAPHELESDVLSAVGDPRVRVVIRDGYLAALPASVQQRIDANFRRDTGPVWVRRDQRVAEPGDPP